MYAVTHRTHCMFTRVSGINVVIIICKRYRGCQSSLRGNPYKSGKQCLGASLPAGKFYPGQEDAAEGRGTSRLKTGEKKTRGGTGRITRGGKKRNEKNKNVKKKKNGHPCVVTPYRRARRSTGETFLYTLYRFVLLCVCIYIYVCVYAYCQQDYSSNFFFPRFIYNRHARRGV